MAGYDPLACPDCRAYYVANRDVLVSACATVGVEHGVHQGVALRVYLTGYHRLGHVEPEPRAGEDTTDA